MGSSNKQRFVSLDALRVVAMVMVVTLHFLGNEALLTMYPRGSFHYMALWAIEIICIVAVNCYVLISGYFLSSSQFKIKRLIPLAFQTLFYSLGVYVVLLCCGLIHLTGSETIAAVLPIPMGMYWFMSAYVGLYLLSPFINKLLDTLDQRLHLLFILALVGVFSIWPSILTTASSSSFQGFNAGGGYSVIWFIVLYVVATYLRRYRLPGITTARTFLYYASITATSIGVYIGLAYATRHAGVHPFLASQLAHFTSYNSLPVLLSSVALFLVFTRITVPQWLIKPVAILAPVTLGVYLLTEEPHIRSLLWSGLSQHVHPSSPYFFLASAGFIFTIYLLASAIDFARKLLFENIEKLHITKKVATLAKTTHRQARLFTMRILIPNQTPEL